MTDRSISVIFNVQTTDSLFYRRIGSKAVPCQTMDFEVDITSVTVLKEELPTPTGPTLEYVYVVRNTADYEGSFIIPMHIPTFILVDDNTGDVVDIDFRGFNTFLK